MKSLMIDTSSKYLMIALYNDDKLIDFYQEEGNSRQSENAIPVIEKIISKHSLKLFDIDTLIVTIGPGSYTGVRVGLSIVKTLKTVHNFKVKVLSSLLALAGKEDCISIIDARSKKMYIGVYSHGKAVIEDTLIDIIDFDEFIKDYKDFKVVGDTHLIGYPTQSVNLYENIHDVSDLLEEIEDIHQIVPKYIKDVEAKKQ